MQSVVFVKRFVEVTRAIQRKLAKCSKLKLCLACGKPLGSSKVIRGCHQKCATAMYRAINRGELSDAEEVANGNWLPQAPRGPKPRNAVTIRARSAS